jgi:hypothetical protein
MLCVETLIFSDKIKKINMYAWVQDRILAITNEKIYNIKKQKVKRMILIHKVGGITKTLISGKTEFIIHVPSEYDYRFVSDRREEIIDILKYRFVETMQVNLPIFGIQKANLREFTTTETQMVKAEVIDSTWTFMDDYQQNVAIRNQQFQESKNFEEKSEDEDIDDVEEDKAYSSNPQVNVLTLIVIQQHCFNREAWREAT